MRASSSLSSFIPGKLSRSELSLFPRASEFCACTCACVFTQASVQGCACACKRCLIGWGSVARDKTRMQSMALLNWNGVWSEPGRQFWRLQCGWRVKDWRVPAHPNTMKVGRSLTEGGDYGGTRRDRHRAAGLRSLVKTSYLNGVWRTWPCQQAAHTCVVDRLRTEAVTGLPLWTEENLLSHSSCAT